ncbi:hypothetical protein H9P43_009540 [Blastocladiella emersonii ATCC 22665]|nr:hypothetical protein H9P43_009540 [Blastocladiella emersonii ATCC 22665]
MRRLDRATIDLAARLKFIPKQLQQYGLKALVGRLEDMSTLATGKKYNRSLEHKYPEREARYNGAPWVKDFVIKHEPLAKLPKVPASALEIENAQLKKRNAARFRKQGEQ